MRFSLSWLEEHIDLNSDTRTEDIVKGLTSLGLEVEYVDDPSEKLKHFLVAKILDVKTHPNADRLNICTVNIGKKQVEVVCGAKNARKNINVVFAPIGCIIPSSGMVLKKKEIRGFTGDGMLCSGEELGLEEESDGIIELSKDLEPGIFLSDLKEYNDVIIEIGLTPNRGDCASVLGISRELAALGLGLLKEKKIKTIKETFKSPISWNIDLNEENKEACGFVSGRYFKGLKNKESPDWLKKRLLSIGLRPISCLVDLTNFITFDLGRPLHVFDAKKLHGDLTIKISKGNEKITALDGKNYNLDPGILYIADKNTIVSIAGVIGGEDSSCDFNTTEMFLESALFDPIYVSNSGRKLNILSDARYRFERGVDPLYVEQGLNIMTNLVLDLCGGEVSEIVTCGSIKNSNNIIIYNFDKVNHYSGLSIEVSKQKDILAKLGFELTEKNDTCLVKVPSWRNDINSEVDLIEEIIRLNGYDNIKELELPFYNSNKSVLSDIEIRNRSIRNSLIKRGLYESVTFSFLSEKDTKLYNDDNNFIELDNPISEDLSIMRNSLLPNLVNNFFKNINKGLKNAGLFEVGSIYLGDEYSDQVNSAAGVRSGIAGNRHWSEKSRNVDLYDVKKDLYMAISSLGINLNNISLSRNAPIRYHPGRSGIVSLGKEILGYFGELHPNLTKRFSGMRIMAFEVFPDNLPSSFKPKKNKIYKKYNLMPIKRDFSFFIEYGTESDHIKKTIKKVLNNQGLVDLLDINIFDLYSDNNLLDAKTSIALEIIMQPIEKTLNEDEIKSISDSIIENIRVENNAILKE